MATKATFARPYNDEAVPTSTRLWIRGLREIEPGVFELDGVKPRIIDHEALARGLGSDNDLELEDAVLEAVWKFDMTRLLTDRIEC